MAKKVAKMVKLQVEAGKATPAPPVGPALGQAGVNIMAFVKEFNERTAKQAGLIIPVEITVFEDRSFTFITKTPPAAVLLKKAAGLAKASGEPNKNKVAKLPRAKAQEIAESKMVDLNAASIEAATRMIEGTARSMGIEIVDFLCPWEEIPLLPRREKFLMAKAGKKYQDAAKLLEAGKVYTVEEAVELVKKTATAKFDETIELHVRLGVDPKYADQQVRGAMVLPHGTGKSKRVLVFAKGAKVEEAEAAGADFVGSDEIVTKIQGGWTDFDVAVATPDMMGTVGRLGKILGPRGLMPNPKLGTVTMDLAKAISEIKAGKVEYRTDKAGNVHCPIGKASFDNNKLVENLNALIDTLVRVKPAAAKGQYIRSVTVSSTMGPGIPVVHA